MTIDQMRQEAHDSAISIRAQAKCGRTIVHASWIADLFDLVEMLCKELDGKADKA